MLIQLKRKKTNKNTPKHKIKLLYYPSDFRWEFAYKPEAHNDYLNPIIKNWTQTFAYRVFLEEFLKIDHAAGELWFHEKITNTTQNPNSDGFSTLVALEILHPITEVVLFQAFIIKDRVLPIYIDMDISPTLFNGIFKETSFFIKENNHRRRPNKLLLYAYSGAIDMIKYDLILHKGSIEQPAKIKDLLKQHLFPVNSLRLYIDPKELSYYIFRAPTFEEVLRRGVVVLR